MALKRGERPPHEDHDSWTREQLVLEIDRLRGYFHTLRSCEDARCSLCTSCLHVIFREMKPAPWRIPRKYTVAPWRK